MSGPANQDRVLDHLFDTLLDLAPAQRALRLAALAQQRPELAGRLRRLLDYAQAGAPAMLEPGAALGGALGQALADAVEAPSRLPGELFCGYRIEALIGRGGMSEVYRASRDYGEFEATVALKVLHGPRQADPALRGFLRHEQRALSRLDHPGIARFIDAGEAPGGELYLAMEYVQGEPIADHADRHGLDLAARVDLLVELCRALEHAHARRLVHGDVKSANVLVDAAGRLRLVDFGIASETGLAAGAGPRAFTPECAAPEQRAGEAITTATDVFQVGALAWRLLTGRSRLDGAGGAAPAQPSASAMLPDADAAGHANRRGFASARALARALRGDLDAIVLRCLAPDPDGRYDGCARLREDLMRWRGIRPVQARPAGPGVRLHRFVRRHAWATGVVGVVVGGALVAGAVALYQLRAGERMRLAEADRAVQVEQFLAELFRSASPYLRQDGRDPLAIFAELGDKLLAEQAAMDGRTRARLGLSLAQLQLARGDHAQAQAQLGRAADALTAQGEDAPRLQADVLTAQAQAQAAAGQPAQAAATQAQAVALLERAGAPLLERALAWSELGDYERRRGELAAAGALFDRAMPVILAQLQSAPLAGVHALDRYVRFLSHDSRMEALAALAPRIEAAAEALPADGLAQAELTSVQAELASLLVGPPAAAERFQLAADRLQALLGDGHPRLARALTDACASNLESGNMALAQQQCQRAQTIYYQANGPDSDGVAVTSSNLGVIAYNTGRLREADAHAQRAQRLFEAHGQPHTVLFGLMSQGRHARVRGRPDQALAYFQRADAIRRRSFADNAVLASDLDQERASALLAAGRTEEARSLLASSSPGLVAQLPADRARNAVWLDATRARLAAADGDPLRMQQAIDAALDGYAGTPGHNALEHGWLLSDLGQSALAGGRRETARALFAQALERLDPDSSGVHWAIAWAGHRQAGADVDPVPDARARALLADEGIATPLALAFLGR
jgi:hypothetical protein